MNFAYLIKPPFNFVAPSGHVTGCDVELARHVFGELGIGDFEPVQTGFAELPPRLENGRWRMTTGLFGTDERRESAQFSRPIWALPDGLLVAEGNRLNLDGNRSLANSQSARLAVIRDQFRHRSAISFGVGEDRITVFETCSEAARAVLEGKDDAYASVGRAHAGFIEQNPDRALDVVLVTPDEKPPAFGSFAFALNDTRLRQDVDDFLSGFPGTRDHRDMVAAFGFSDEDVDLVVARSS